MTKEDIQRITDLYRSAQALPAQLVTPSFDEVSGTEQEGSVGTRNIEILNKAHDIKLRLSATLRAIDGPDCIHLKALERISFRFDPTINDDTLSGLNERYSNGRGLLIELMNSVVIEYETREQIEETDRSWYRFFLTKEARLTILVGIVGLLTGLISKELVPGLFSNAELKWGDLGGPFANFEVVHHERIVDLRQWTPTPIGDTTSLTAKAVFVNNLIVRKVRDEGHLFCLTGASSGSNPLVTSSTHDVTQQKIDMRLTGWPNLKNQVIGMATIPNEVKGGMEFNLNMNSVRYRGFSDPQKEWCSIGIWHPTRRLVHRVLFPKGKNGRHFICSTAFFYDRNNFKDVMPDSSTISTTDTSMTWVIENPVIGNAYRIDWEW